jgi:hypothetical protein
MAKTDMHATIKELLEAAFSVRPVPRLYNEEPIEETLMTAVRRAGGWFEMATSLVVEWSGLVGERWSCGSVLVSCHCEKLVSEAREQFGNPKEGERSSLEAVTRQ